MSPACRVQRLRRRIVTAMLLMLCGIAVSSVRASCPALDDDAPSLRYSLEDVAAGRLPQSAALNRMRLQVGDERIDVAVVTDAARDELGDGWPVFQPQTRLMLVALDTGLPIWELMQSPHAAADGADTSDPRLTAALGAAAILRGADGLAQRLYVGDSASRVWRIDLPLLSTRWHAGSAQSGSQPAVSASPVTLLADLTPVGTAGAVQFRMAPDLVRSMDSEGTPFDGVLITSEGTVSEPSVSELSDELGNGLFFLRDYAVQTRDAEEASRGVITWPDLSLSQSQSASGVGAGWFAPFRNAAEVARSRPVTDGGRVFLVTASWAAGCDEPPLALTYVFNLSDGRPFEKTIPGSIAGVGPLSGPTVTGREIILPGLGIALPATADDGTRRFRSRFTAEGVFARVAYWRNLLLDAD
ncbi:hypothetical protein [Chromatocurvus halotolerans]|uniref:hypothetical protein n=1 Tax=Chromatocurvus halotolerans TaxID=1132028 RepID=UPI0013C317BD|nr:hypothetical protein [Chromatocurvus halotolerans]